jgi:hypothetical protein
MPTLASTLIIVPDGSCFLPIDTPQAVAHEINAFIG